MFCILFCIPYNVLISSRWKLRTRGQWEIIRLWVTVMKLCETVLILSQSYEHRLYCRMTRAYAGSVCLRLSFWILPDFTILPSASSFFSNPQPAPPARHFRNHYTWLKVNWNSIATQCEGSGLVEWNCAVLLSLIMSWKRHIVFAHDEIVPTVKREVSLVQVALRVLRRELFSGLQWNSRIRANWPQDRKCLLKITYSKHDRRC
jgi:hypothetical protein